MIIKTEKTRFERNFYLPTHHLSVLFLFRMVKKTRDFSIDTRSTVTENSCPLTKRFLSLQKSTVRKRLSKSMPSVLSKVVRQTGRAVLYWLSVTTGRSWKVPLAEESFEVPHVEVVSTDFQTVEYVLPLLEHSVLRGCPTIRNWKVSFGLQWSSLEELALVINWPTFRTWRVFSKKW